MRGTEQINNRKWKQHLINREKEFHLFRSNTPVAEFTNLEDGTKRLIKIEFVNSSIQPILDFFTITSGREVALPKVVQEIVKQHKRANRDSIMTFEVVDIYSDDIHLNELETTSVREITIRTKQQEFRKKIIEKYRACVLTGLSDETLLIASHIKPWRFSNDRERLDVDNGILLSINCDALFDKGYISFSNEGVLIRSSKCSDKILNVFNIPDKKISLSVGQKNYLEFHRNHILSR